MGREKRELRKLKREINRAGSNRRPQDLKRAVVENPGEAPYTEFAFGRTTPAGANGMDRHATRRPGRGNQGPDLLDLLRLCLRAARLGFEDSHHAVAAEDVMTAANSFREAQVCEQASKVIEPDVRVRVPPNHTV